VTASTCGCALRITSSLRPQAAGDDHLAVFGQRFADGVERLLDGGVDEAAGIDDHQIGPSYEGEIR
jgi:hypothetical protein